MKLDPEKVIPYKKSSDNKRQQIEQMFDNIAPKYDFLNRALSLGIDIIWRKQAIAQLKPKSPKVILDIATGTADLALEAAKQLKPNKIVGLDIAENMLSVGRKKIKQKHEQDVIELIQGDSTNLLYNNDSFDAVMAAYGVRNFHNLKVGLKEMIRVLKPGGTLLVLEFSKPEKFPVKQLFNFYFRYILPNVVSVFPQGLAFINILKELGLKHTEWIPQTFGISSIYLGTK